ncbi:hypothetical protein KIP88_02640 [Bradyrhizobium sp. SRL28]|uniref:hypothetical protein n=1 Tax=Bradyrhizobium sp. SRL28 TaxID=2836178 RepID=UPI001BDE3C60|nr:hypothetical protein [Bradyrhizobium sp. SRL28]MBT1509388.1 hypothetical protein [Bradyrhizobium sp. SRL28]
MTDLDTVLQAAVQQNFCKMFDVLMSDPSPQGLDRFKKGLHNLAKMENAVADIIEKESQKE